MSKPATVIRASSVSLHACTVEGCECCGTNIELALRDEDGVAVACATMSEQEALTFAGEFAKLIAEARAPGVRDN